jgi:hypothetical protein
LDNVARFINIQGCQRHTYSLLKSTCAPNGILRKTVLAEWEFEHIKVVERANREERARLLAEKCRDDAARAGINKWALEIAAGGHLTRKLIKALNEAEFQVDVPRSAGQPIRGFR